MDRTRRADLAHALWRMALLYGAGVPLVPALEVAWDHASDAGVRDALQEIHRTWFANNADCLPVIERRGDVFSRTTYHLCTVVWLTTMAEGPFQAAAELLLFDLRHPQETVAARQARRAGLTWLLTFGTLLGQGVSALAALEAIKADSDHAAVRNLCTAAAARVTEGRSLVPAIEEAGATADRWSGTRAGVRSGTRTEKQTGTRTGARAGAAADALFSAADVAAITRGEQDGALDAALLVQAGLAARELGYELAPAGWSPPPRPNDGAWEAARQQLWYVEALAEALTPGSTFATAAATAAQAVARRAGGGNGAGGAAASSGRSAGGHAPNAGDSFAAATQNMQAAVAAGTSAEETARSLRGPFSPWVALLIAQNAQIGALEGAEATRPFRAGVELLRSELQFGPLPHPTGVKQSWFAP